MSRGKFEKKTVFVPFAIDVYETSFKANSLGQIKIGDDSSQFFNRMKIAVVQSDFWSDFLKINSKIVF
jgi:hypothetical protein